jgi:hypothetical protein
MLEHYILPGNTVKLPEQHKESITCFEQGEDQEMTVKSLQQRKSYLAP